MKSISDFDRVMNTDFFSHLKTFLTDSDIEKIRHRIRIKRNTSFRVNTLKGDENQVVNDLKKSFKFAKFDTIKNCYIFDKNIDKSIINNEFVTSGKLYIQSISSMIPPFILNPQEGESVLDIAASPGSKTSLMAALTNNNIFIDAVEPDFVRMERLKKNIEVLGVKNVIFHKNYGESIIFPKKFDKILADVPCSGEGRLSIYDSSTYKFWSLKLIQQLSKLQIKILRNCIKHLKVGGEMVYSTCTLNPIENELVVKKLFDEFGKSIEIMKPEINTSGFKEVLIPSNSYNSIKIPNKIIENTIKILPSDRMEGFYICKIKKNSE